MDSGAELPTEKPSKRTPFNGHQGAGEIDPRDIQDRLQMHEFLSQSISDQYREFASTGEVLQKSTFVKSYLVECHSVEERPTEAQWKQVFHHASPLRDPTLILLQDRSGASFFADVADPRFAILHTIDRSETTDTTIERLTQGQSDGFDRAWLPAEFLFGLRRGALRGFKFGHQRALRGVIGLEQGDSEEVLEPDLDVEPDQENEFKGERTPKFRTNRPSRLAVSNSLSAEADYAAITGGGVFHGRQALDSIVFARTDEHRGRVVNDLYSSGKVVGNGTSIAIHLLTVDEIRAAYSKSIELIEQQLALGWVHSGDAVVYRGEPLVFHFPQGMITDLYEFVLSVFTAAKPFRLFGIPHSATERRIDVEAIDLHTNDPLAFEITYEWMRVYLPRGSCGNIIARLYTNLQHVAHSDITLSTGSAELLFTEASARAY